MPVGGGPPGMPVRAPGGMLEQVDARLPWHEEAVSISLRGRDAVALALAVAAHVALLAAPTPERPLDGPAEPPAVVDGIDFEIEPPAPQAAAAAPEGDAPAAGEPEAAEIGRA